jgi:alpha-1,6-mannosyltransferase
MATLILDSLEAKSERAGVCALAVMSKAPRAGKVKTRLAPALGFDGSAAINICFLRDTTMNIAQVSEPAKAAGIVCYTPVGDEMAFDGLLPESFVLIPQRGDAFGERLLAAAEDILACGYGAVCLIDSDSPTLPTGALQQAVEELAKPGDRVVLGGSDDGGYYLIGLKRAHKEPFERITWSTASVYAETVERVRDAGIELVELPIWYDVDDAETLKVLEEELLNGKRPAFATVDGYAAESTREFLQKRHESKKSALLSVVDQAEYLGEAGYRNEAESLRKAAGRQRLVGGSHLLRDGRPWMTNVMLCLVGMGLLMLTREYVWEYGGFGHYRIGGSGCSGLSVWLYLAAIVVVWTQPVNRVTFGIIVGFAVALRAAMLFVDPFMSSDIYRYVWDGIAQHAGVNPYRYVPGDLVLTYLRAPNQDIFDNINRRDYAHTIYPPVAQMVYWLVTFLSPTLTAMKTAMVGFECIAAGAMLALLRRMGRRREEILLYAWCPLVVWEISGSGHVDAAVFAFILLALVFRYREQPWLTGLFFGLAVFSKFYPLVLFPALYKRGDWKMPAVVAAVGAVGYAVYSSVGMKVFGFLLGYSKEEGIDSGARFFLLDWVHSLRGFANAPVGAYMVFCVAVLGGISVWAWRYATVESFVGATEVQTQIRCGNDKVRVAAPAFLRAAMLLAFAMMLLFSPHYPWYIVWLVPFLLLVPNLPLLVYVLAFFYLFTTALADPGPKMFLLNRILYGSVAVSMLGWWVWMKGLRKMVL